jgi:hypothetical protein
MLKNIDKTTASIFAVAVLGYALAFYLGADELTKALLPLVGMLALAFTRSLVAGKKDDQ